MKKLLFFMMTSLNGYYERGPWGLDWHNVDEEFNEFAAEQLDSADVLLFGRATYEGMASYWPTPAATEGDSVIAGKMNSYPKIVFTKTLERADWNNTRLVTDDAASEIAQLKQQPGKDLLLLGSSDLAASLADLGLIDEYRIMVNPILLEDGKPLLKGLPKQLALKLVKSRPFGSGNVLLTYEPAST